MPLDIQSMPAMGGTLVAALAYAGVSAFITGPLIGERMIEKSGWAQSCPTLIVRAARAEEPDATVAPSSRTNRRHRTSSWAASPMT